MLLSMLPGAGGDSPPIPPITRLSQHVHYISCLGPSVLLQHKKFENSVYLVVTMVGRSYSIYTSYGRSGRSEGRMDTCLKIKYVHLMFIKNICLKCMTHNRTNTRKKQCGLYTQTNDTSIC